MGCQNSTPTGNSTEEILTEIYPKEEIDQDTREIDIGKAPPRLHKKEISLQNPKGSLNPLGRLKSPCHSNPLAPKDGSWKPKRQRGSPPPRLHWRAPTKEQGPPRRATPDELALITEVLDAPGQLDVSELEGEEEFKDEEGEPDQESGGNTARRDFEIEVNFDNLDNVPWKKGYSPHSNGSAFGNGTPAGPAADLKQEPRGHGPLQMWIQRVNSASQYGISPYDESQLFVQQENEALVSPQKRRNHWSRWRGLSSSASQPQTQESSSLSSPSPSLPVDGTDLLKDSNYGVTKKETLEMLEKHNNERKQHLALSLEKRANVINTTITMPNNVSP